MSVYVEMPSSVEGKRAPFYLAAEEYIAHNLPEDDYLFTWQIGPTVVMGRHQVAHLEVDLDFCRAEGIDVIRRKSGGGCIFADYNNIMVSRVTGSGPIEPIFQQYAEDVTACLNRLGAPVEVAGRNDIVLNGRKICGNAFYHLKDRNIVHGTMLYDTNERLMQGALTPDKAKMSSKGVTSVKSRVGFLKDYLSISVNELREELRRGLTDRSILLTDEDIQYIKAIEAEYYDPDYLFGKQSREDKSCEARIPGVGSLNFRFSLIGDRIDQVSLQGDFFEEADAQFVFKEALVGTAFKPEAIAEALQKYQPERAIRGLEAEALRDLLLKMF